MLIVNPESYLADSFYREGSGLIQVVDRFAEVHALVGRACADHLCFKCDSAKGFERVRGFLEPESLFTYQSYIAGRRIAVIRLKAPFKTVLGPIDTLELSDQKPDLSQGSGFDHVEIYPVGMTYEELVRALEERGVAVKKVERPHHTTHDIQLADGYQLKLTREPLIEKIKRDEMI